MQPKIVSYACSVSPFCCSHSQFVKKYAIDLLRLVQMETAASLKTSFAFTDTTSWLKKSGKKWYFFYLF